MLRTMLGLLSMGICMALLAGGCCGLPCWSPCGTTYNPCTTSPPPPLQRIKIVNNFGGNVQVRVDAGPGGPLTCVFNAPVAPCGGASQPVCVCHLPTATVFHPTFVTATVTIGNLTGNHTIQVNTCNEGGCRPLGQEGFCEVLITVNAAGNVGTIEGWHCHSTGCQMIAANAGCPTPNIIETGADHVGPQIFTIN